MHEIQRAVALIYMYTWPHARRISWHHHSIRAALEEKTAQTSHDEAGIIEAATLLPAAADASAACSRSIGMPKRCRGRGRGGFRYVIGDVADFTQESLSDERRLLLLLQQERRKTGVLQQKLAVAEQRLAHHITIWPPS